MHYYKRNLGEYAKKAGRLSMLQHGAYTLLIDSCYDREEFPTLDQAIEWTWASSKEEIEAVEFVLRRFFTLENDRYVQNRIKEELIEYHSKAEINKRIANERETKRKENRTNREQSVNESPPKQEPVNSKQETGTINQEPLNSKTLSPSARDAVDENFEQAWAAYPKRPGASKKDSLKAWSARLKAGVSPEDIIAGVTRYAAYCAAMQTEPQFIKQPVTFFGNGEHWKADWTPQPRASPSRIAETAEERNARIMRECLTDNDENTIEMEAKCNQVKNLTF